jgi:superfamily I DNA and RNA helicase
LIQVTEEQCETLADLEVNRRMIVHGLAGTGKTILAQEFAKRLAAENRSVLLLFYNKGIAAKVRFAFDRKSHVTVTTFSSFAKRLVEANDPDWWKAQTDKDDDFWQLALPSKLFEIPGDKQPTFDAIIVDEGQDFKPEWYEYLQTLLKAGTQPRFCVFLDEHQDIFGHWDHFPCSPPPARKLLSKNCRNTRSIVEFINQAYPIQMICFDKSPAGVPVVERTVRNEVDEQTKIVQDIKTLLDNEKVKPGAIVVLLNDSKEKSCLADTKTIAGYPLVSTYGGYDSYARHIYYSTIDIFKGLEADVILLVLGNNLGSKERAEALYVQGSRAKHLLYVYRRGAKTKVMP